MATTDWQGFFYDGVAAGREVRAGLSRRSAATRPLPMEELCFFTKPVDNSRLVRVIDPRSRRECLGLVGYLGGVFLVALLYLAPYLGILRTGYRIEEGKKEHEALVETNRQLQVKEARLKDPQRIYNIARGLGLDAPAPEQVLWQEAGRGPLQNRDLLARNSSGNRKESER